MSRIAIVTDTHFGARGDSQNFLTYFRKFFDEIFFPFIDEEGIDEVVHLGDLVDRRKYINFNTLSVMRRCFLDRFNDGGRSLVIIPGNHDTYFKNTNDLNALREIVDYVSPSITVVSKPTSFLCGKQAIAFVPWICDENRDEAMEFIAGTDSKVLAGHFDMVGFEMSRGTVSEHGLDHGTLFRFNQVWSGHYHHRSSRDNVRYLGSPYEMTWADHDDPRGFHTYDTETGELKFIKNPLRMFEKIDYDPTLAWEIDPDEYVGKYVRVMVKSGVTDRFSLDSVIERLEKGGAYDVQVIEDRTSVSDDVGIDEAQDTLTILKSYVDQVDDMSGSDKKMVGALLEQLYSEALMVE